MKAKFDCYFEREEKGVFMEVDAERYENLIGFTFFAGSKVEGEVCVDEKGIESLIEILQAKLKKNDAVRRLNEIKGIRKRQP